jgi:hypothetical protein
VANGFSRFVYLDYCSLSIGLTVADTANRSPRFNYFLCFLSYTMWNNPPGNWPKSSQLEFLITRATTAAQPENNYALHIEIAEYINKKKANTYVSFY